LGTAPGETQHACKIISDRNYHSTANWVGGLVYLQHSLRTFAAQAGIDPTNLYDAISGKRPASQEMLAKFLSVLMKIDD